MEDAFRQFRISAFFPIRGILASGKSQKRERRSSASAVGAADRCLGPFHCSGEPSSIMALWLPGGGGAGWCWLGRCIDKLSDGLADYPRAEASRASAISLSVR
jgi:hypothetical protein